jgi:methyltransferase-like protein
MLETRNSEVWQIGDQYVLYKLDISSGMFWLFDIREGTCFNLNKTSYFILSCFDGKAPLSEIRKCIMAWYIKEDSEIVSKDFDDLFEKLRKQGILERVSSS